ncbi:MAG: cytochrome c family protein [Fimbriimonadales bacterium]|jgi:hypothetical protein|nr:cytochrome c family protein [Fimbriimonadales bacterium]
MPQVFSPASNVLARASVPFGILLIIAAWLIGANITPYTHRLGVAIDQPAPFSHKHHFKELGIDCRYCHTTVEESRFAGIPPTETCMTCHSQIWTNSPLLQVVRESYLTNTPVRWNRVNETPDFVFFDHSIHIARGVSCFTCHGAVDEMNLTFKPIAFQMVWCLDCHRNPERFLRPKDQVVNPNYSAGPQQTQIGAQLVEKYKINKVQIQDCWVCHR